MFESKIISFLAFDLLLCNHFLTSKDFNMDSLYSDLDRLERREATRSRANTHLVIVCIRTLALHLLQNSLRSTRTHLA
jgi:hypothetical protein